MDTKKLLGYILSALGLAGLVASSGKLKEITPIINSLSTQTILIVSGVLVIVGILLLRGVGGIGKKKQVRELPIYEGKGKKREVVAYQRE